jgi:hypothetical protein
MHVAAGRIIARKYCLLYELGRGGMGSVWAAEHLTLRSTVAVKLIDPRFGRDDEAIGRFTREAQAGASIGGPHVVQVLDFGVDAETPFLVMELLEGESLAVRLERQHRLSTADTWELISQLGRGIGRAHAAGFVHRDLKPDNVFLVEDGDELLVKILDFGIAKALEPKQGAPQVHTRVGRLMGTPHYMSPEQARGESVDGRADLWSMGVIAYECLLGTLPFQGNHMASVIHAICRAPIVVPSEVARVPFGFDAWFARAVTRDRAQRFQSVRELIHGLREVIGPEAHPIDWVGEEDGPSTSVDGRHRGPRGTLVLETYPADPGGELEEVRYPSQVPASIDGRNDIRHVAVIRSIGTAGALLVTRNECKVGQELVLTLHLDANDIGESVAAEVERVDPRGRGDLLWKYQVSVRFKQPLADHLLLRSGCVRDLARGGARNALQARGSLPPLDGADASRAAVSGNTCVMDAPNVVEDAASDPQA